MSIICPNLKNEEVAREFEELKNATSEAAAYHIWSLNNGNSIDKAPNGEPSKLFSDLLEHYNGDRVAAIQAKARTYSESFRNWFGDWTGNVSADIDSGDAIDYLYSTNTELSKVGSKEEYAQYVNSIYPNSLINSIYWHGTDSDLSQGVENTKKGKGSGAPETGTEMYFNKQPWASLQYVSGVNRNIPDTEGYNNWVKLWWELKEALGNGRMESNDWKNEIIGPNTRQYSPNKRGIFNRDKGGSNGKYLSERKARYGYQDKTDKEFFEEVFDIRYGKETFNDWVNRKKSEFQDVWKSRQVKKGMYPAVLNVQNPIVEKNQNTYYEEQRGLFTKAKRDKNDAIVSNEANNEFRSDVVVIFNPKENVHFLGTKQDIESFKNWKSSNKDKTNVSKVVDENGEPKLMFHGSDNVFDTFRNDVAIYTTDAMSTADSYFYSESNVNDRMELFEYNSEFESYGLEREGDYARMEYLLNEYFNLEKPSNEYDNPYSNSPFFNDKFAYRPYKTADDFLHKVFPDFLDHIDNAEYRKEIINTYVEHEHPINPNDFYKRSISGRILPLFVSNKNPLVIDGKGSSWNEIEYNGKIWSTRDLEIFAKNNNYDGLIINNIIDLGGRQSMTSMDYGSATVAISYNPNQVKSIDNQGTFSTQDNNIYNQKIVNRETRLENFYNSYVKLRTKTVEKAENETELRKRRSKLSSNSKLRETNLDAIMQEILGIYIYDADYSTTDSTLRELNNLSESRYLTLLNEEIDKLDRLLIPVDSLIAAVNNINKGYNKLSDYSKEVQDRLFNMPVYREATELPVITRAKSLKQYNAYQKIKYNKELNTFISNLKLTQLKLAARKYHLDTIKMFVEEYDRGFEDMKLKVLDEYLYRTSLLSKKAPKLQGTYNLLEDLAKGQSELDTRNANEQMQKISNVTNIKQALELLSKELPEYAPFIRHLQEIPYYEDILIEIDYNSEDSFALTKAVGNTSFKIDPETNEYTAKITINKESFGYRTLLHEIVHAFSSIALAGRDEYGNNEFVSDIIAIIDHCNKYFEIPKVFGILMQDSLNYGFTNPQEFIAEFFSNPAFQMLLKEIPAIGETEIKEKNIFKSVVEAITKFFASFFNKEKNLYNQIEPLMYKIIDFQSDLHKNNTIKYNPNREYNSDNYTNNQVITKVISNSKDLLDNSRSKMATVLRDVANKTNMQPVSIEYTDRPLNEIYPEATYWTPAIYDRNTNKIVVNTTGDFSRYGSLENVLLHEIAHAITLDSLAADTEAANELRAIQKEYAATHEDHASKNVYEFAAELFSNPEVIHNMQDFPAPTGKKTILQRLMDWFKRLFGKNTTHENLINRIVENVIEYNAYQTLEHNENTDDYIPLALPAASKREEIAATKLMSTFDSIVKTLEIRTQSMQYNPIDDSFDRRETVRNTSVFNRLNNLSNTVKNITDPNSMLDVLNGSIEYMNSVIDSLAEAEKVLDNINEKIENAKTMGDEATTNKYRVALDNFGAEYLYPHEANLNNLYETVFSQEFNDAIYESLLGTNVFNDIRQTLNALRAEFSSIKMDSRNNIGWKYKNTVIRTLTNFLKGEMEEANDPRIESALMNWLSFDSDISSYHKYAGLPNSTNNVVISSVRKVIGDVNNEVHKKVYHKYAELMGLAAATRDHLLLFERNSKGKKTGYIIRDRKYGEYQNDKYNWRKKWLKDHKLASVDELKLDQNLWLEYQRAYNDWKSKHAERKYTPEFYDIFANLSIEANQALSEVNIDIDNLLKPYLDNVTKKPRFENMSQDDYDKYQRLLEKKRNLANPYDALTGEIKPEDSVEYKIAMELTEAYEKLRKGLKSKANMAAFMAEMEKMREIEGYTPDGRYTLYEAWLERNTRWEYTPEFEALVSKQNKKDYGEIYDRLYQARTNLLKLYRTDRYEVDYVRMPQEVKEKIRELDIAMYRIRRKSGKLGGGRRLFKSELSDIAKDNGGKDAVSPDDIWVDDKGVKHYFSYMTTVKPINDKYMHRVPNNNWAETSEESAFYNPNYDPTIPEAEQPKLELYDNRKDYNAVMRNTNLSKLRQALIDTIGETNAKLTHTNYRNDYKLPQIPGTIWNYISGKGLVTGVRDYMLDAFAITPDDELHGVKNKVRPNGTEINIMPTQYTTMLADPSVGTNDLVGAVMRYYRMGCNYEAKKKVAPQLNLLDETIKREGKVVKSQNTVSAANSNLSNVIHKYISYHLYGRRTALPEITIGNSRISLDKIFRHFATWGRDIGLSWNLRSAISGGVSAWSFYAADAYINRHMNVRDFTLGNAELAKELLTLKTLRQLGKNMGDSDLVSMLEYNGLSFNQEEDMANTNRWRVGRMITRTIEPYSAFKLMSFLPNSVFMRGIYNNYRLLELEDGNKHFISENDFLYNHFPEQSIEEKRAIYNSTKTTLWSAYDKKGGVKIKPEYKKYVTKELENEISDKLGNISSHAEGMVETADKSGVHLHTALSTILMFRAFLPKNIENTWNPAYWNYQTKELAIGTAMAYWYGWLYGANNWGIKAIRALTFRNKERDISELSDKFNVSESYTRKQIETYAKRFNAQVFTYIFWLTLFNALGMIGSTGPDDDYWYQNILMLELKKISLESGSRYNVMDIADIFNSVSPLLQTVEDIGTAFGPWSYFKERKYKKIKKGAFKGLYGWQRDFIKVIPWLNAYYNMKNPGEKLRDLQNRIGG